MLSVSLFWTGAIVCNTLHVVVAGLVTLVLRQGAPGAAPMPRHPLLRTLRHAVTTSLGSICYGSLFTAAIRTLRWAVSAASVHLIGNLGLFKNLRRSTH